MSRTVRAFLARVAVLLVAAGGVSPLPGQERPAPYVPFKPATKQEKDHAEALKLFGLAVVQEHDNRLLEATRTLEEALRLEPDAHALHQALIPLYLALDRVEDALFCCRRALELDPDDYATAYLYARQLRVLDRWKEARAVLQKAAARPGLKEQPELRAHLCFDLGVLHENAEDWKQAEASYRVVLDILEQPAVLQEQGDLNREEIDTQAAETYERLGRVYLHDDRPRLAIDAFQQARKKDPTRGARLALNLAEVYDKQGQPPEALASLEDYLRTQPQGLEGYQFKIRLQRKLDRADRIVPDLEEAARRDPHNLGLKLLLAREYQSAGKGAAAEGVYQHLIQDAPSPDVYRGLFGLYQNTPEFGVEKVLEVLNRAVEAASKKEDQPGDSNEAARARAMLQALRDDPALVRQLLVEAHRSLGGRAGLAYETRMLLATLAFRTRQLDVAEHLYRSCLDQPGLRGAEHEAYAGLLRVLGLARKYAEVVAVCQQGLQKAQATNRVMFHLDLAEAHMALGHAKEALAAAELAVNESGEKERLLCRRVRVSILTQAERYDQAVAECQALLKEYNQPGEVRDVRTLLAGVYSSAHDPGKSEEQLRLVLEADPNDARANNDLGYQWADQNKNLDEAERMIRKALDLDRKQRAGGTGLGVDADQDNAAYVDSLGWVLFRQGHLPEARKELEKACALPDGGEDPVVWDHLGDVLFRLGQKPQAAKVWKKAIELYETGGLRRRDERYKEIQEKLRHAGP